MKITLTEVSKRFQRHWVFKGVSRTFEAPGTYALLGPNGSGKSTLLRVIAGMQAPSAGKVLFESALGSELKPADVFQNVAFCAPGQELVEEFTLREFLEFHFSFKKPLPGLDTNAMIAASGLGKAADKPIYDYSSGMKQRVKLIQAIFADTPVLMLDEPCSNLDENGVNQYRDWIERYAAGRMVFVASNDPREYFFCREQLVIEDYQ